jgi:hypothetical protein
MSVPVNEPEFRAIPLTQNAHNLKLQTYLDGYAHEIIQYHPDGKGAGDKPGCPCCMCVRLKPDATEFLKKAADLTLTILSTMNCCDQNNLQRVLGGLDRKSCLDPYNGEMGDFEECECCHAFYKEFLGTLMYGSRKQMGLINDLLHDRAVSDVPHLEDVEETDTAGILIQILFHGTPDFVEHIRTLIYEDQNCPCDCKGCSVDDEENYLVTAINNYVHI